MAEPCLLDNDIVLKIAAFRLNGQLMDLFTIDGEVPAMLGVGRFVLRKKSTNGKRFRNPDAVTASLEELLDRIAVVEPVEKEIELAAQFEAAALEDGLAFDVGEAQLLAVLVTRVGPAIVTGDKRAIAAAASLKIPPAYGRFICLEQVFICLVANGDVGTLRVSVCEEADTDRTLSICFACSSIDKTTMPAGDVADALVSYVGNLRKQSGEMLMADECVSTLTA